MPSRRPPGRRRRPRQPGGEKGVDGGDDGLGGLRPPGLRFQQFQVLFIRDVTEFQQRGGNVRRLEHHEARRLHRLAVQAHRLFHLADQMPGELQGIGLGLALRQIDQDVGDVVRLRPQIDAGDPAFLPPPHTDQRGTGYARVWGDRIDIGAVERVAPPRIMATQVNDGAGQRSRVMKLTVTFDRIVNFVTTVAAAFQLQRNSDSAMVSFTATENVVGGVTVVTLTAFAGAAAQSGSLADGRYTLTADAEGHSKSQPITVSGKGTRSYNISFPIRDEDEGIATLEKQLEERGYVMGYAEPQYDFGYER